MLLPPLFAALARVGRESRHSRTERARGVLECLIVAPAAHLGGDQLVIGEFVHRIINLKVDGFVQTCEEAFTLGVQGVLRLQHSDHVRSCTHKD